ncbi:MAG: RDD family protein [Pseudomonadales bacterium]|nr:RDD family protein [Pseudomonadales bacterium]
MSPTIKPAGITKRLGAILYDSLLVFAIWFLTLVIIAMASDSNSAVEQIIPAYAVQIICLLETLLFFYFFWMYRGRTLGMMAWHTHLATASGIELTPKHVVLRIIGAILNIASLGLGYVWIIVDKQNRSFSDLLSGTYIMLD